MTDWIAGDRSTLGGRRAAPDLGVLADVIYVSDGSHHYWSTHCRHGDHEACAATAIEDEVGGRIARQPAQCKACAAACRCGCHEGEPS